MKCILKAAVFFIAILIIIPIAGFTGVTFAVWPTSWFDHQLLITPQKVEKLKELRIKSKFHQDMEHQYPGTTSESVRLDAEARLNALLDSLVIGLPQHQRKAYVMKQFKVTLSQFKKFDSEDNDRLLLYLEEVMDVIGIRSSDELFNVWRYGFPYGWMLPNT